MSQKPQINDDLARKLAEQFLARRDVDTEITVDNFLKDAEITVHRDDYVVAVERQLEKLAA